MLRWRRLLAPLVLLASALRAAPTHEIVAAFQAPPVGPRGELVADGAGFVWGTSEYGGTHGLGSVYKVRPDGTEFTVVVSFAGTFTAPRGARPVAALVTGPGGFYGTTSYGGQGDFGTIFRVALDGTLTTLVNFTGTESPSRGSYPIGGLVLGVDGTTFYGTASAGGANDLGTVFSVTSAGTFTTLLDFDFSNGGYPFGSLVRGADGYYYGTTQLGGSSGFGTVFKCTSTGVLSTLVQFANGGAARGAYPQAGLVRGSVDGQFFGATYAGGSADKGTVFKVTHNGVTSSLTTLVDFTGTSGVARGAFPDAALIRVGSLLYGTTYGGGSADQGTVFSVNEAGVHAPLVDFTNTAVGIRGGRPRGGLLALGDGTYVGTTAVGGVANHGTVFRVDGAGTLATVGEFAHGGTANRGLSPSGAIVANGSGGFLGTTAAGGTLGQGTVFEIDAVGSASTRLDFTGNGGSSRGASPFSALAAAGGGEYIGTTYGGGANALGTIFRVTGAGAFATQVDFTGTAGANRGANPQADVILASDGQFYGVSALGGTSNFGTLFRLSAAGVLTPLVDFTRNGAGNRGSTPLAALLDDGAGLLYGSTRDGGAGGFGTLFKSTYAGVLTTLVEFTSAGASNRGAFPAGSLLKAADGQLYGTTQRGGAGGFGTLFKVTTAGALTTLVEFTSNGASNRGAFPLGGLVQTPDGHFLGLTSQGGARDFGTLFRYSGSGNVTTLGEFSGSGSQALSGASPAFGALLFAADGNLYGTTTAGGPGGGGTVFRLRFGPRPTTLAATEVTDTTATLRGIVNPIGVASTARFEWGLSPSALTNVTTSQSVGSGSSDVAASAPLTGLSGGTTYYFRMRGDNAEQFVPQRGTVISFTTPGGGNHAPVAGAIAYATPAGQPLTVAAARLVAVGSDVDGDTLSVTAVAPTSTAGGTVVLGGANITYTPPGGGFTGSDTFTYTLSDGQGGTAPGTVQVTVVAAGQPLGVISSVTFNGASTILGATGFPGVGYVFQSSDDLTGSWTTISPLQLAAAGHGAFQFNDTRPRPPHRFFRLLLAP